MEAFTPVSATIGGLFIGLAATLMLWANGRIAGISGILAGAIFTKPNDTVWRVLFLGGLMCGGLLYLWFNEGGMNLEIQASPLATVIAGLLVGFGTRLGSGCTSGHGICGIARLSKRSLIATLTFMLSGFLTVWLSRHVF